MFYSLPFGTFSSGGGCQLPSRIDGEVSEGPYTRRHRLNVSLGAGSQLASLSFPGDSAWR